MRRFQNRRAVRVRRRMYAWIFMRLRMKKHDKTAKAC